MRAFANFIASKRKHLGFWVLVALVLTLLAGVFLGSKTKEVEKRLRDGEPATQWFLTHSEAAPQAFHTARDVGSAEILRTDIQKLGAMDAAKAFHRRDLLFMAAYSALLVLGALWAHHRGKMLLQPGVTKNYAWLGTVLRITAPIALVATVVGLAGDLWEYRICTGILGDLEKAIEASALDQARGAYRLKWGGVAGAALLGILPGALAALLHPTVFRGLLLRWELVISAWRFATRARFSLLAAGLYTALLFTGPGQDIIRTVATGVFRGETVPATPDFMHLGWLALAMVILGWTCWGWARLLLAMTFNAPNTRAATVHSTSPAEERLRRDLPVYYGAVPFVVTGSAFATAPLSETGNQPIAQLFAAGLAPILIFFLLPLLLVVIKADTKPSRNSFGPLSWTLLGYIILAAVHGIFTFGELRLLAWVPFMLFTTALLVFGLGQPKALYLLPAALAITALYHGVPNFVSALPPIVSLIVLCWVTCWGAKKATGVDQLHVKRRLPTSTYLKLTFTRRPLRTFTTSGNARLIDWVQLRGLLQWCFGLLILQVVLLALFAWIPGELGSVLGSAAILCLGLSAWAVAGGTLLFLTQASRFPILGAAFLFAVICSATVDNHGIRLSRNPAVSNPENVHRTAINQTKQSGPVANAFQQWLTEYGTWSGKQKKQCIIVAAEGGGIRAAFWPAVVLGTLQDASVKHAKDQPDFASHIFAMSGVSGGSVGLSVFQALCAENRRAGDLRDRAAKLCGADHLAPTLAGLMYPDFSQRFIPVALLPDRAKAFEQSWEEVWRTVNRGSNRMAEPFLSLWATVPTGTTPALMPSNASPSSLWMPNLFLNTTMVETGKRMICSNLPIQTGGGGTFIDTHDFHSHLRAHGTGAGEWQDVPLSAAAHTSARFPLVSPPARLPSGARVVDGGYFENSGVATGFDILQAAVQQRDAMQPDLEIVMILFRFSGEPGLTDVCLRMDGNERSQQVANRKGPLALPVDDRISLPKTNPLNETLSILGTLLNTRTARGSYSQDALATRYFPANQVTVISFTFGGKDIPLSWSLSQRSCKDILNQLPEDLQSQATDWNTFINLRTARMLMNSLYGPAFPIVEGKDVFRSNCP